MVGRREESRRIEALLQSKKAEFLAVTGRRRVGKTYLVDSLLRSHYCFSMTGIQKGTLQTQLTNFSLKLAEYQGADKAIVLHDWQGAFVALKKYLLTLPKGKKHVLFIDELPWVNTPRSGFIQLLAHFWNDFLSKEPHFLLVICGSASSWINNKIINDPGGLHNRLTEIIHLRAFNIAETKKFLEQKGITASPRELVRIYMALGGIPFYLDAFNKGESFPVAIERLCFAPNGLLKNEFHNLYAALFSNAELHQAIVSKLASHPQGMSNEALLKALKTPANGSYRRALKELVISDFVEEYPPFGRQKRGTHYRLVDEYTHFYMQFIHPQRRYTKGIWQQIADGQSYKTWVGFAFEMFCAKHVDAIKAVLGISSVFTETYYLNIPPSDGNPGFQIDLLIDRKDEAMNLCEMKFHAGPYAIQQTDYQILVQKKHALKAFTKTKKQVFITLITANGLAETPYSQELVDAHLTLEQILDAAG